MDSLHVYGIQSCCKQACIFDDAKVNVLALNYRKETSVRRL